MSSIRRQSKSTIEDYALARRLLVPPVKRLLGGGISAEALELYDKLNDAGQKPFKVSQICKNREGRSTVYRLLGELETARAVEIVKAGKGSRGTTWKLTGRNPADYDLLPSVEEIAGSSEMQQRNAEDHDTLRLA